ncbi:MAG: diacylglycerol kinase [Pseudomonadota bacterium]
MSEPVSEFKSKAGLGRILPAIGYGMAGLKAAWQNEHAFRQEAVIGLILTITALALPISAFQKMFLIAVLVLVMIVELINSAIEAIVDRISLERHPLSKNAKDMGSAAVMLSIFMASSCWIVVLFNRFY